MHIFERIYLLTTITSNIMERTKDHPIPPVPTQQDPKPLQSQPLSMPIPGDFFHRDDFEDVRFWTLQDWKDFLSAPSDSSSAQSISKKTGFLTDGDGNKLTKLRLKQMRKTASEAFIELYNRRLDPPTWGSKREIARRYFAYKMREEFEEFRMCNDDWKAEAFATLRYPDWCDSRAKGNLYIIFRLPVISIDIFFQVMSRSDP